MSAARTMAFARHGHVYGVVVHSVRAPTDAEWDEYLRQTGEWLPEVHGVLIVTEGGGPTSSQRRSLKKMLAEKMHHSIFLAVISSSMLARGIVLAINLFNPYIRAFHPEDLDRALSFLGVPVAERPALLVVAKRLREEFDAA